LTRSWNPENLIFHRLAQYIEQRHFCAGQCTSIQVQWCACGSRLVTTGWLIPVLHLSPQEKGKCSTWALLPFLTVHLLYTVERNLEINVKAVWLWGACYERKLNKKWNITQIYKKLRQTSNDVSCLHCTVKEQIQYK
jgi:hypothetical protein